MKNKKCFKCGIERLVSEYYHHPQMSDGKLGKCKDCTKKDVRQNRIKKDQYYSRYDQNRYRNDNLRMWKLKYCSMNRRIKGLTKHSKLLGKDIISKKEFLDWCIKNKQKFIKIYNYWEKCGYKRKFAPSIDRIDNTKGYIVGNLQWLTQSDNAKKQRK